MDCLADRLLLLLTVFCLVYQVIDEKIVVFVVSVRKRECSKVYSKAVKRIR